MVALLFDLHFAAAFPAQGSKMKVPGWVPGEGRWEQKVEAKVDSYLNDRGLREALCFQDRALLPFRFAKLLFPKEAKTKEGLCAGETLRGTGCHLFSTHSMGFLFDFWRAACWD